MYFGRRQHLTEKTFKPIAMGMPFVLSAPAHSLSYLRSYGFKTFGDVWSEKYDSEEDDYFRSRAIGGLLRNIDIMSATEKQNMFEKCIPIIEHNWNHFYNGGFEKILWEELNTMLDDIKETVGDLSSN